MQIEQTLIFWAFVSFGVASGGITWMVWAASQRRAATPGTASMVRASAKQFHERVRHFTNQVRTLDEHSNEYTSIFRSEEWGLLVETVSHLERTDQTIQQLVRAKQFDQALLALQEVQSSKHQSLDHIQASLESYKTSADWELNVHRMLKRVVLNLEAATHETKELSRTVTSRKRQPTLMTLADVKKTLLEEEVLRRSSRENFKN